MKRYGSIYIIKNKINGKIYVGQTIFSVETRWKKHLNRYNRDSAISRAFDKYGEENFEFIELCSCFNQVDLDEMEKYFIQYYNSTGKNGYNKTYGGKSSVFTKETREKMALAKIGKPGNNRKSNANQSGSGKNKKILHAQRLDGETTKIEYNPSKSPRQPSKYELLKEEITKVYLESNSSYAVASKLNLDKSMVCEYLRKWGILKTQNQAASDRNKNRYIIDQSLVLKIKEMFLKEPNKSKISKQLNLSEKTVARALKG